VSNESKKSHAPARDPDLVNSESALRRAAERAREQARRSTGYKNCDLTRMALTYGHHIQKLRHASESWYPESAYRPMLFQTLDSGFRRNDGTNRSFFLK
jgi:hypothetical protein